MSIKRVGEAAVEETTLHRWPSRRELEASLRMSDQHKLLLGQNAAYDAAFYTLLVGSVLVGIVAESASVVPRLYLNPNFQHILVGYNKSVALISRDQPVVVREVDLFSQFDEFLPVSDRIVVVIYETGALALTGDGAESWRVDEDVVQNFRMADGILYLEFMDAPPARIEVLTGARR